MFLLSIDLLLLIFVSYAMIDLPPSQSADLHTSPRAARLITSTEHRVSRIRATGRQAEEGRRGSAGDKRKDTFSSSWLYVSSKLVRGAGSRKEQNLQNNSIQGLDNIPSVLGNTVTRLHAKPHLPRLDSFTSPTHSYPPHPPSPTLH